MYLAVVNTSTNIVENVVVPPTGANVWFVPDGYDAIETEVGAIGDTWNGTEFVPPPPPEEPA